ncbi:MAG TPA: hypothetical protein VHQ43_08325 [Solirubrobacterales bacterium]|jgi:hypothetical protein|nr:hypothetical protein [Solirubrobacterales bacterium]
MRTWEDAATWRGAGLRREVFFFGPAEAPLYGSLYSAEPLRGGPGVLVCASWGYEADRTARLSHYVALSAARGGGAGMVFHYPGYGDSHGPSLAETTLDALADAAASALEEGARRCPQLAWFPAGLMVGAAVACLAQRVSPVAANRLLLVQPALSPEAYFARLAKSTQRVTLGPGRIRDMSFAYPLPAKILAAGPQADASLHEALAAFDGDGAVVRCARPPLDAPVPPGLEELVVDGSWRFGTQDYPALEHGVGEWLAR